MNFKRQIYLDSDFFGLCRDVIFNSLSIIFHIHFFFFFISFISNYSLACNMVLRQIECRVIYFSLSKSPWLDKGNGQAVVLILICCAQGSSSIPLCFRISHFFLSRNLKLVINFCLSALILLLFFTLFLFVSPFYWPK